MSHEPETRELLERSIRSTGRKHLLIALLALPAGGFMLSAESLGLDPHSFESMTEFGRIMIYVIGGGILLGKLAPDLAASLDGTSRLASIAQVVVPLLADWCVVYITEEGRPIQPVAVAHADPQKLAQVNGLLRRTPAPLGRDPPDPDAPPGAVHVLRSGRPEFYPEASEDLLAAIARDAEQIELVRSLGIKSAMIVPLVTRGHTLGTITLVVSAESGRQYTEADLALAEELARRAALAVLERIDEPRHLVPHFNRDLHSMPDLLAFSEALAPAKNQPP